MIDLLDWLLMKNPDWKDGSADRNGMTVYNEDKSIFMTIYAHSWGYEIIVKTNFKRNNCEVDYDLEANTINELYDFVMDHYEDLLEELNKKIMTKFF